MSDLLVALDTIDELKLGLSAHKEAILAVRHELETLTDRVTRLEQTGAR